MTEDDLRALARAVPGLAGRWALREAVEMSRNPTETEQRERDERIDRSMDHHDRLGELWSHPALAVAGLPQNERFVMAVDLAREPSRSFQMVFRVRLDGTLVVESLEPVGDQTT